MRPLFCSAGLIGLATLASRVLGLVRDVVQGIYFGTGPAADAFFAASRVPSVLRDLFAEGAMSAAFVPTFTRTLARDGEPAAWRLGAMVINGLLLITGVVVLAAMLLAEPIVGAYASGYADDPAKFHLTVTLTRLVLPFLTLIAVATACMGMLNGMKRFAVPAASPALYNVFFIATTVVLTPVFLHRGIEPALALGVAMLLGGVAQIAVQWPTLRAAGYRHRWTFDPRDPSVREVLVLLGPGAVGMGAAQINLLVNTSLATSTDGAVSALQYAFRLMYLPIGVFSVSVATAALPDIARHAARRDHGALRQTLSSSLRLMMMLGIPAAVGLMALARPIVSLIFERGAFDAHSTALVAGALTCYAPGIIGYSAARILSPTFYSLQDARTPILISLATVALNLALNLWLYGLMGFLGLPLGASIAAGANAGLLLWVLSRRIGDVDARHLGLALLRIVAASAVMGAVAWGIEAWLGGVLTGTSVTVRAIRVGTAIGAGLVTLAGAAWLLRIEEFHEAVSRLRRHPEA